MTTVTEISVAAADVALAKTFEAAPDLQLRVKSVVGDGPAQTMPLVWLNGDDPEAIEEALESDPTVEDATRLLEDPEGGEWLYKLEYAQSVIDRCGVIFDYDGTILDARCAGGRWTFRLLFPDRDDLSNAMGILEEDGVRVDVKRMIDAGRDADLEASAALTDAQEEAITEAYRQGYYDVPRAISLEELAAELDISHQALSERLRRANKVLAGEQLEEADADADAPTIPAE